MAIDIYIGDRKYFDTDAGRFITGYVRIPYSSTEITGQTLLIHGAFYLSALITAEYGAYGCPVPVGETANVTGTTVVLSRTTANTLVFDTYGLTVSAMTEHYEQAYCLTILETSDNKWYPLFTPITIKDDSEVALIIQATASGFGNVDAFGGFEITQGLSPSQALIDNYIIVGEKLRNGTVDPGEADPYDPGGDTGGGGGEGDFDNTGDDIDFPTPPTLSAVDTGFITLFNPTLTELRSLASYMWSSLFDIDTLKKLFADPMKCILGLSVVPVNVPAGLSTAVKVGNISTGVSMTLAASQYVTIDCGSLNINEYWGAYLDYSPFTQAEIYLPYCGIHPINIDDIMGKTVSVKYNVDILSGACCAMVKCGGSVLYSFIGQCAASIPISGNDWSTVINGVISAATAVGSMVLTGGGTAPTAIPALASTAVNAMKPNVERSGAMGGTGGMMGLQKPYIILTRPRQAVPKNQNKYTGYPSFINETLGELNGYTEVELIHLENVPATDSELNEIETILKSGVIL